jgi:hypothetical protein
VAPYAVCTWHVETRSVGFLVEPQNQGQRFVTRTVFAGLASKPVATVFSSLVSKLVATVSSGLTSKPRWWRVSWFEPQNRQLWFGDLRLKIIATVS